MTDVNSIEDLTSQADQRITGIEPGAGIMTAAKNALKDYDNLSSWELVAASTGAMTTSLDQAIKKKDPIVVTAWSPHWMFAKYDLKYLKDSKETFGSAENINTIARKGLKKIFQMFTKSLISSTGPKKIWKQSCLTSTKA